MTRKRAIQQDAVAAEVRSLIEDALRGGVSVQAAWITDQVVANHPDIQGEDRDFYLRCAYLHVRRTVLDVTRDYDDSPEREQAPAQLRFEGFERLQKAYLIEREDGSFIVPIELCTVEELRLKSAEYRKQAAGCLRHADELDRYIKERVASDPQ